MLNYSPMSVKIKNTLRILLCLILVSCPALGESAESAGTADAAVSYDTLFADMIEAYDSLQRIDADVKAMNDQVAGAVAEHWKKVYLNPDYHLYLFGKDDPSLLPIRGRHAFVVLGYQLRNGEMTEELKGRCDAAAAAARAFPESLLVCTGGATGGNNPENHTEAGMMKDYLVQEHGIAPERIFTDELAMTTAENAVNTFVILREQGIETMTVVTSSYHQRWGQVLYNAMAARYRFELGYPVELIGNYCFDMASADLYHARTALSQLRTILNLPTEELWTPEESRDNDPVPAGVADNGKVINTEKDGKKDVSE